MKGNDIKTLQIDLDKLWECAVENAVEICSRKKVNLEATRELG
jgi:hypothetical protein